MLYIKNICTIIFIIITIVFTVGYTTQPLIVRRGGDPLVLTNFSSITNIANAYKNNEYANLDNNIKLVLISEFYLCISATVLLTLGIVLTILGLVAFKFISKILFIIALIIMIIVCIILQILISTDALVGSVSNIKNVNYVKNLNNVNNVKNLNNISMSTSNDKGYYMIMCSTGLMIVTYIIYSILG